MPSNSDPAPLRLRQDEAVRLLGIGWMRSKLVRLELDGFSDEETQFFITEMSAFKHLWQGGNFWLKIIGACTARMETFRQVLCEAFAGSARRLLVDLLYSPPADYLRTLACSVPVGVEEVVLTIVERDEVEGSGQVVYTNWAVDNDDLADFLLSGSGKQARLCYFRDYYNGSAGKLKELIGGIKQVRLFFTPIMTRVKQVRILEISFIHRSTVTIPCQAVVLLRCAGLQDQWDASLSVPANRRCPFTSCSRMPVGGEFWR